jgi:uncharacterized membrane protein YkvA (DUF1232 family)
LRIKKLKVLLGPYRAQFDRSPRHIKLISILCVIWLASPIDPFDILFPWAAFTDDIFIAGALLKMLYKHGGLPEDKVITPIELLKKLFGKDPEHRRTSMTYEELAFSAKIFLEQVSKGDDLKVKLT